MRDPKHKLSTELRIVISYLVSKKKSIILLSDFRYFGAGVHLQNVSDVLILSRVIELFRIHIHLIFSKAAAQFPRYFCLIENYWEFLVKVFFYSRL